MFRIFRWLRPRKSRRMQVFRFVGQTGPEYRDPVILRRRLDLACPKWSEMVNMLTKMGRPLPAGAGEEMEAQRKRNADMLVEDLGKAVASAFDLPPVNAEGKGYTEAERIVVLADFLAYCADILEDTRPLADGPRPTGSAAVN